MCLCLCILLIKILIHSISRTKSDDSSCDVHFGSRFLGSLELRRSDNTWRSFFCENWNTSSDICSNLHSRFHFIGYCFHHILQQSSSKCFCALKFNELLQYFHCFWCFGVDPLYLEPMFLAHISWFFIPLLLRSLVWGNISLQVYIIEAKMIRVISWSEIKYAGKWAFNHVHLDIEPN